MPASVSKRAFIQWLPEKPSESTSTIVLTSPGGNFVDVRLLHQGSGDATTDAQVDWAFAGTSKSTTASETAAKKLKQVDITPYLPFGHNPKHDGIEHDVTHSTWTHTISSRTADVQGIADEGDMLFVAALGLTLEQGCMKHPDTQRLTDYMEGWLDEPIDLKHCVVLKLDDPSRNATGLVMKLDHWAQGVVRVGDAFSLERWYIEGAQHTAWTLKARDGDFQLPIEALRQVELPVGAKIDAQSHGQTWIWEVIENTDISS